MPRADRSSQVSIKDVLVGVGFLLSVAAFVLSLRNARQLRTLREANSTAALKEEGKLDSGPV